MRLKVALAKQDTTISRKSGMAATKSSGLIIAFLHHQSYLKSLFLHSSFLISYHKIALITNYNGINSVKVVL